MRPLLILTTAALLFNGAALAEDNDTLPKAAYVGTVTGNEEKDTYAFDPAEPSDLQVRFKSICEFGTQCPDQLTTGALQSPTADETGARYFGTVTGDPEKDTYAH